MSRRAILLAALVAALQIGFLGWMIAGRAAILRNGQEVMLKVEPVDPRDLLRGDYVRLGYEVSSIPVALIANPPAADTAIADARAIIVRLGKDPDGYWRARSASFDAPAAPPADGEIDLRGTASQIYRWQDASSVSVTYGIERYYVPEGEGKAIEQDLRERSFGILVAVAGDGTPQIKALYDGTTAVYEEPPY